MDAHSAGAPGRPRSYVSYIHGTPARPQPSAAFAHRAVHLWRANLSKIALFLDANPTFSVLALDRMCARKTLSKRVAELLVGVEFMSVRAL